MRKNTFKKSPILMGFFWFFDDAKLLIESSKKFNVKQNKNKNKKKHWDFRSKPIDIYYYYRNLLL